MARRLRASPVMTQAQIATARNFNGLAGSHVCAAGQKARNGWQGLPGAVCMEAFGCR
jgi:hypothetical protein